MDRVAERLEAIYAISATRIGGSAEEDAAHELAARWMAEAGLEVETDGAGNLFGRRGNGELWLGSHLDSVPNGGRYDGALGVVGAIEIAERVDVPLTVVAFRDEERGYGGSLARVEFGELPRAFLELHIEQGPVLDRMDAPLGIVTAIAGQARGEVVFSGRADHAGTTPMDARADALVEAAQFVLRLSAIKRPRTVATVGRLEVEPGAANVVPARVTVSVDARAATAADFDAVIAEIGFDPVWRIEPVEMHGAPLDALRAVVPGAPELASGAGHDAGVLAAAGVPSGMLFVRSRNGGISHSPDELSSPEDIALALDALERAVVRIAG
ncbi:MAG TPA: M20/M25/M40 family metallo-hydrolase [Gaiellaceae bacterium]|nr:M20/M25/M40 family metallo-hydrolase [Gaiellaceae bacterium]